MSSEVPRENIIVIGAGAMGAALATHLARAGRNATLAGTSFDDGTIDACRSSEPHPALGVPLPGDVRCVPYADWDEVVPNADVVVLAVSSDGLRSTVADVRPRLRGDATWVIATKGWDSKSLLSPSEIVAGVGDFAVLGGPALAPELVAGAPTSIVCASYPVEVAQRIAGLLRSNNLYVTVTDDVAGAETAAAYKNVIAIVVGMCEGLGERLPESVFVHRFANARAATFAVGLQDMARLALARGGRAETIIGLAGAGDLYVTCLGGRNGTFGRLIGSGQTTEQAQATIGSTVEGVANTAAALAVAQRLNVELPTAKAVDAVLNAKSSPQHAIDELLSEATT